MTPHVWTIVAMIAGSLATGCLWGGVIVLGILRTRWSHRRDW